MCCSLSRVKGGVECCGACHEKSVWWCGGGGAYWLVRAAGVFLMLWRLRGYWRVVGEGVFLPPLFFLLLSVVFLGYGEAKGGGGCFGFFLTRGGGGRCGWVSCWREG